MGDSLSQFTLNSATASWVVKVQGQLQLDSVMHTQGGLEFLLQTVEWGGGGGT